MAAPDLGQAYSEHALYLRGLCYRMTGSFSEAEDLVQETFARALEKPPADTSRPWRPWLARVAVNLSRDHLRQRKRREYTGPWLPEPVAAADVIEIDVRRGSVEGAYEQVESVSLAFLTALEALTPSQRAVLLLRDVLEYSARETAEALDLSEANVRTTHHRARAQLRDYDEQRFPPSPERFELARDLMARFLGHAMRAEVDEMAALLSEDAVAINDSNGRYPAARVPVVGREKVARFHTGLLKTTEVFPEIELTELNGLPALLGTTHPDGARYEQAPHFVTFILPTKDGLIRQVSTIVAPEKVRRLFRSRLADGTL